MSESIPSISMRQAAGRDWDAVVIGAGLAGGVAALGLVRAGVRTLLIDRVAPPRWKVCGCCLAPQGAQALAALGLEVALRGARPLASMRIRAMGREASAPITGFSAIGREALDARIVVAARAAGAETLWGAVARAQPEGRIHLEGAGGERAELRARAVVAADGLGGSSLRGEPGADWCIAPKSRIGAGARLHRAPLPMRDDEVLMLWERAGYLGLVRLPDGSINVAAAWSPDVVRAAGGLAALAAGALRRQGADPEPAMQAVWSGAPTLTRVRHASEFGAVILAGDAAGYAEPFTGRGMTSAILGGIAAATEACARLSGRAPVGSSASLRRRIRAGRRRDRRIGMLLRSATCVDAALRIGAVSGACARLGAALAIGGAIRAPDALALGFVR